MATRPAHSAHIYLYARAQAKPAEKEKPVKSPRKPTKPGDTKERSVPGHTDLRHSEAPLVSAGTGEEEEEEEEGEGDEEEASLTRGRKGKEKATSKTAAARKKTIVVDDEDNEGDEAAGEVNPACAFPEWTQRDLDEELFFYPDDIAFTVLCTHPASEPQLQTTVGSHFFCCCWGSFRIRTAS